MPIDLVGFDDLVSGDDFSGDDLAVGDDLLAGADADLRELIAAGGEDMDMAGAMFPSRMQQLALRRAMLARRRQAALAPMARTAIAVKRRGLENARRFPLGFESKDILALEEKNVTASPQVTFRGERLVIPSDIATFFTVIDVKIGNRSQLVASGVIPASVFSEVGVDANLRMDTAQVSMEVVIRVQNVSASTQTFRAAILGTAVY